MEPIIQFEHIDKKFGGVHALSDVSFEIARGEVHALVGENGAGKSTLMNILSGLFLPDSGQVYLNGSPVQIVSPTRAKKLGIATVYQELKMCGELTIAENVFLGRELRKNKVGLNYRDMNEQTEQVLSSYGLDLEPATRVGDLTVAQMQVVEIARAISLNSSVLILDEPTSSLTENETRRLFENIRNLRKKGVTVIFITHRLEEVFEIADRISVLRDGKYLKTCEISDITPDEVVALIAGKSVEEVRSAEANEKRELSEEVVLEVEHFSRGKYFKDVSFKLHRGEILGFYGLQGAGRSELIETIFGIYQRDSGVLRVNGREVEHKKPRQAILNGIAFVPEDRKRAGIFNVMSILENMAVVHDRDVSNAVGLVSPKKITGLCKSYIKKLSIKADSVQQRIGNLSGGNQQKVVIARGLSMNPDILLMDEPTRGIDVGAKSEIFKILRSLRDNEGKSIIVISSELSEVVGECDRVIVMKNGRICGEVSGDGIGRAAILDMAFNGRRYKATEIQA